MDNIIAVALKAIILYKGKALLIQRSAQEDYGGVWEFAGGGLEFGEDLETALKREVQEEAGLEVSIDKLLYASAFKTHEHRQIVILTYLCTATDDNVNLSAEHQDYLWANKAQLKELLSRPIMNDLNKNNIWDILNVC